MQQSQSPLTDLFHGPVQHSLREPFISDVDIIDEKITIVNPSMNRMSLAGYKLSDFHGKHIYEFPDDFVMHEQSKVVLFCCPGKRPHVDDYQVNHLLWKNKDGTLRRKEVLNNSGDTAILLNANGEQVALCTHLGEMKLLAAGVVPGERTGVLPYWKVLLLPILILFLMSYFFEAPPETFHTKLQDVIQHLNETQDGLVKAHHRAIHMQKNYDNLLNDYMSMQKEVEDLRVHCSMPCEDPVRKEEVDALFEEFKEQERALLEEIRGDFEALRRGKESESDADSNSTLMQKVSELEGQIDELQDETVLMVRSFESLEESFDSVKQEYLKAEEQVQKDLEEMENELMEELETYIKELPPPEMDELLREQAISIIKEVSRKELEEIFASRVEELKLSFASQGVDVDGEVSESDEDLVEVDQDSLEKLIVDALSQELAEVRSELHGAIANAVDDCNQSVHDTSKSGGTSQRDFALRRAGGQVMYSRTSSTYTPNEAEQNRLHQYESQDFTGTATKSLRSSLSGMLTGALDQVESLLGNDVYFARRTLFETGVGGPDEAISEDLSLGSCWAMKGKQGFLTVRLKDPLLVTSLTIDHVSPHEALDISTAPAKFKVYGYSDDDSASYTEKKPKLLHAGTYDIDKGQNSQTFQLSDKSKRVFQFIKLEILTNHGNSDYTCLYRFRVHGTPP